MTTAYFMAPVRGRAGDSVSAEKKASNVEKGKQIGQTIRGDFPCLDIYIPHEHEDIVDAMWRNGVPSEDIVKASCDVALSRDFGIAYIGDGISKGMGAEIDAMMKADKIVITFVEYDEHTRNKISWAAQNANAEIPLK